MNLVYVLLIENYDALDGYTTSIDVKLFKDENTCIDWISQEAKKQADKGFKMKESFTKSNDGTGYWEFVKESDFGEYRHEFSGMYRNVLKEAKNYD